MRGSLRYSAFVGLCDPQIAGIGADADVEGRWPSHGGDQDQELRQLRSKDKLSFRYDGQLEVGTWNEQEWKVLLGEFGRGIELTILVKGSKI